MRRSFSVGWVVYLAVVAGVLAVACGVGAGSAVEPPQERIIHMAAIEPKRSTTVDKEPFPVAELPAGRGYGLKAPDEAGKWVVETYRYIPGTVVVNEGDMVTLEIVGINGKEHPFHIDEYGVKGVVKRGEVTRVTFLADKPGDIQDHVRDPSALNGG